MAKAVAILLFLVCFTGTAKCNPIKPKGGDDLNCMLGFQDIVPGSDKCYYISELDDYQSWDDAINLCNGLIDYSFNVDYNSDNTGLVSINSNQENNELFDQLTSVEIESAWIGLSWSDETNFIWNNDESNSPSYFHWAPGEPNLNPDYATNYVQLMSWTNDQGAIAGKWLIPDDQTVSNYICQAPKVSLSTTPWYETTTPSTNLICMNGYEDVYPTDNKCYYFSESDDVKSWEDAYQACDDMINWDAEVEYDSLNCYLASIDSQEQHQAISKRLKNSDLQSAWIGLSWTEDGNWTWNSDDTEAYPSYFNWEHGEPNLNLNIDVNYAQIEQYTNKNGKHVAKWIVPDDQTQGNYICQSPKVPQSESSTTTPWWDVTTTSEPWWDTTTTPSWWDPTTTTEPWWDTTTTPPWWDPTTTTEPWWDTTTTPSNDDMVCMEGFNDLVPGTGKCYYISTEDELQNWEDAEDACDAMINYDYSVVYTSENTKLVVLNSDDENDDLFNILLDMDIDSVWIGLSGAGSDDWTWNEDYDYYPTYFNWAENEPNINPDSDINYVQLMQGYDNGMDTPSGKWFVAQDQTDPSYYVCQAPKIPRSSSTTINPQISTTPNEDLGCMPGYEDLVPESGKCYYFSSSENIRTRQEAVAVCDGLMDFGYDVAYNPENTQLVSISSDEENDMLFNEMYYTFNIQSAWIGLSWNEFSDWTWNEDANNLPSYFNWADGEPNQDSMADQSFAKLMADWDDDAGEPDGRWYVPEDQFDADYFICQSPKVPNSFTTPNPPPDTSTPDQGLTCMEGYEDLASGSGKCYLVDMVWNVTTWDDATDYCNTVMNSNYNVDYNLENTQLVSIGSEYENDQLINYLLEMEIDSAWIGLGLNDDGDWTWNGDDYNTPDYLNWAESEPNLNPYPDTNYAQIQQDWSNGGDVPTGTWFIPGDQIDVYYFICQSPTVPYTPPSPTPSDEMVCMPGYQDMVDGSDKCYFLTEDEDVNTWDEAMDYCDSKMSYDYSVDYNTDNTKLATIASDDENDQLFQQISDNDIQSAWIGLNWNDDAEDWTWNGDSSDFASYTNWAEGQPIMNPYPDTNNAQLQQDYTTGDDEPVGTWFVPGDQIDSYSFICQSPKVPQSEISSTTPGWDTTTTEPWWDTTTTPPWWDTTTTPPWWDPTTTTEPWWDTTTTPPWWDPTTTTEPWWDTTTTPPWWDPTTTTEPWWDTTTTPPFWDPTTTTEPWWDTTTTPPWWDPTTTTEPWWDTTTTPPWWDPTTTTEPWWDTTTTPPWWDPTTTTEPWWDTTTTPPWWDPTTTTEPWWDTTTTPPRWETTTTENGQSTTTPSEGMTCMEGYDDIFDNSGKCYYISVYDEDMLTWEDAKDACSERMNWNYNVNYDNQNTMLVSINSIEENDALFSEMNDYGADASWIGLSWNQDASWTWNDDPTKPPKYFNWAEGEPNVNPDAASNYVLLQEDDNSGGDDPMGTWVVPDMQNDVNYYICQSPKIPISDKTTPDPYLTTTTGEFTTSIASDMVCMDGFEDWIQSSEKCFYISYYNDDLLSWDDANTACMQMTNWNYDVDYNSLNTQLISIDSDSENDQLYEQLSDLGIDSAWIGLGWSVNDGWTWNQDSTYTPSYFSWADGEPNVNPDADTNYVQAQSDEDMLTATWLVPDDQTNLNYYVCQSPKIPQSQKTTTSPYDTTPIPIVVGSCMNGYDDLVPSSSKCYLFNTVESPVSWKDASSLCNNMMNWNYEVDYTSMNTQLVSIDSQEENNDLYDFMTSANIQSAWIGLSWSSSRNWTWNANPLFTPSYTNWAENEPNLSDILSLQYVKLQQNVDDDSGNWFVEQNVTTGNTNFICQSPKVPNLSSAASPLINQLWFTILFVTSAYIFVQMMI